MNVQYINLVEHQILVTPHAIAKKLIHSTPTALAIKRRVVQIVQLHMKTCHHMILQHP